MAQCSVCGQNVESGEDIAIENLQYAASALAEFQYYWGAALANLGDIQSDEGVATAVNFIEQIHTALEEVVIATEETFPDPEAEAE